MRKCGNGRAMFGAEAPTRGAASEKKQNIIMESEFFLKRVTFLQKMARRDC